MSYTGKDDKRGIYLTAADAAARSGDLQTTVEYANGTRQTIQLWDQFRVWDPGD